MPELDPFDVRLESAVHAFADAAQTRVDAAATAERAMHRGRAGRLSWLGHTVPVPVPMLVALLLLVLALVASLGIGGAWNREGRVLPVAVATVTPEPLTTDGEGDEVVTGTEILVLGLSDSGTTAGDVTRLRGGVITTHASANDPRVTGTGTWSVAADLRSGMGPAWGTYRLQNEDGAWEGTCTGGLWNGAAGGARSCLLAGSGAYAGYTYSLAATWSDEGPGDVRGVIYPGSSPVP